jgi:hypothetical protein
MFIVNVVMTSCGKPVTKLTNLLKLLRSGADIRPAQFDMYRIVVNGTHYGLGLWILGRIENG